MWCGNGLDLHEGIIPSPNALEMNTLHRLEWD
jgi:hypothetical protein